VFLKVYFKVKCMIWFLKMYDSIKHGDRIKKENDGRYREQLSSYSSTLLPDNGDKTSFRINVSEFYMYKEGCWMKFKQTEWF
jgi:hypothetical protein